MFGLAEQLGIWNVPRLEREMPMPLFFEWSHYFEWKSRKQEAEAVSSRAQRNKARAAGG